MGIDFVTGATGFIGRHLTQRLIRDGRKVRILCRPASMHKLTFLPSGSIEVVPGDLCERRSIETAMTGVEKVFHCAGHVSDWGSSRTFHAINVQGTQWLLEAAFERSVRRFVHLSSIAVFGVPAPPFFDDSTPYGQGNDLYSRTKIEGETLALRYHRERGFPVTVLRPAVVYGPCGTWVTEPIRMIHRNAMFLIAGGKGTCHPCYIDNLIDAMLIASEHPLAVGQAYIVGDDQPISFKEYFNALARIAGEQPINRSIPLVVARTMAACFETLARFTGSEKRPLLTQTAIDMVATQSVMSMDKIRKELDFHPKISVERGMERLKEWLASGGLELCAAEAGK